jgi:ABC-type oligopeptide transport system substrate-binding subunit
MGDTTNQYAKGERECEASMHWSEAWLNSQRTLKYQIIRAGYSADYNDPTTFLDMWNSGSSLNHSGFKDESYDQILLKANVTTDTHVGSKRKTFITSR